MRHAFRLALAVLLVGGVYSLVESAQPPGVGNRPQTAGRPGYSQNTILGHSSIGLDGLGERLNESRPVPQRYKRLPPSAVARPTITRTARPQFGTGRVGRESTRRVPSIARLGRMFGRRQKEQALARRDTNRKPAISERPGRDLRPAGQFRGTPSDRILAKRLADIDHLRDVALRNGNVSLLDRADELERLARKQYARRTGGDSGSGITQASASRDADDRPTPPVERLGRDFGRSTSETARLDGREFGATTSQQAREQGREFGSGVAKRAGGTQISAPSSRTRRSARPKRFGFRLPSLFRLTKRGQSADEVTRRAENSEFGRSTSGNARLDGRQFGSDTAEQARNQARK